MLAPFRMVCGNFILPEPASYVFFCAVFNLRNLLYLIALRSGICCPFVIPPKPKCCPPGMRQHTKNRCCSRALQHLFSIFSIVRITQIPATNQVPSVRDFRRLCDRSATLNAECLRKIPSTFIHKAHSTQHEAFQCKCHCYHIRLQQM